MLCIYYGDGLMSPSNQLLVGLRYFVEMYLKEKFLLHRD